MKCQELHRDDIAEKYLNGQLDPAAQDEFEVHILECTQCLQRTEAVQALRQELDDRAHQIRAYSQVEHFRFRWKWATVAAFSFVVCGLAVMGLRTMKASMSARTHQESSAPADVSKQPATSGVRRDRVASNTSSSQVSETELAGNLPINGRRYVEFTPTESAGNSRAAGAAGDETAKELFRLSTVHAPPFTFSGFASSGKDAAGSSPSAVSGNSSAPDRSGPARPYFRSAMDAYVEKRYTDAIGFLEQAVKAEPNAPDLNFYLGVCRLLEAKPGDSITPFNVVLRDEGSPLAQGAHFYLAKALIQTGDLAQAEPHLQSAAALPGSLSTEASLELARLRTLRSKATPRNAAGPH